MFPILLFRHFNLRMKRDSKLFSPDLVIEVSGEENPIDTSHIYSGELYGKSWVACVCLLKVVYLICSIVIFQFKAYLYYLLGDFSIETLLNVQSKQEITSQISQDLFLAFFFPSSSCCSYFPPFLDIFLLPVSSRVQMNRRKNKGVCFFSDWSASNKQMGRRGVYSLNIFWADKKSASLNHWVTF